MALIKCAECNKEISEKATACPHCGCPNNQVKCPECSNFMSGELMNCPNCGYPVRGYKPEAVVQAPTFQPSSASSDTSLKKGCLFTGGLLLFLIGITTAMLGLKFWGLSTMFIAMLGYVLLKGSNEY